MSIQADMWIAFAAVLIVMFIIDLGIFNRKAHEIKFGEALTWAIVWILLALLFNVGIYIFMGPVKALEFLTGYVIEKSLSVDNLFVFIMIFSYFHVAKHNQPKILKWGIIGALAMRAVFIMLGIELIERFHWMIYIFGALLVITGIKMAFQNNERIDPGKNLMVRLVRKVFPVSKEVDTDRFFIREFGKLTATPLFLALVVVESSDVIFAVDSIPAVLAVTHDPFIVYTSNVFAILGLRSLYYLLAHIMEMFVYLKLGVSFILCFVGVKMVVSNVVEVPIFLSLGVIIGALVISILVSVMVGSRKKKGDF